jgi:hypothetical protein
MSAKLVNKPFVEKRTTVLLFVDSNFPQTTSGTETEQSSGAITLRFSENEDGRELIESVNISYHEPVSDKEAAGMMNTLGVNYIGRCGSKVLGKEGVSVDLRVEGNGVSDGMMKLGFDAESIEIVKGCCVRSNERHLPRSSDYSREGGKGFVR